jgi:beta-galactosidase
MKKKLFLLVLILSCIQLNFFAEGRVKYNFNADWKLYIGDDSLAENIAYVDTSWQKVNLPSAFNEGEAFRVPIAEHTGRVVWYRKTFVLPAEHKNQKIFIEFEGARQSAEVWLNGKWIGLHEDGVMAFGYDLTPFVTFGTKKPNVLAVRIDNSWTYKERSTGSTYQWNNNNFNANFGGLTKNVYLYCMNKLYQTLPLYNNLKTKGLYIYPTLFDIPGKQAVINVESEVRNEYDKPKVVSLEVNVRDIDKLMIREFSSEPVLLKAGETKVIKASATIKNLNFWSWGYGYLYEVTTRLSTGKKIEDIVKTKTGFRKTEFANGMFKLNNRVLQLKGYAQRTSNEWPGVGMSVPAWLSDYSNGLMVESNANIVRWMHVTPWKQDVESCDRVGLLEAMPAGDAEGDSKGRQWEQRKELMRDAIIYNRNNPSIAFYECGNENISEDHMSEMESIRDEYDPKGGRAIGSREMLDSKVAEYGGEMLYINKSATKPVWAMEYCRDEALRLYWDEQSYPYHKQGDGPLYRNADASSYNQNQDMFAMETVVRWYDYWRERPGTGKRVSSGGASIIFSDSNTHCRGAENYRRSGKVDAMRIPKDAFFAHQVMWDGWVDVENFHTHLVGHWNYKEGTVKNVYVVSSGDKVQLFLNDHSLGYGEQSNRFWFTFKDVAWKPGVLKAVSYDAKGEMLSQDVLMTVGTPNAIKLTYQGNPVVDLMADGSDMVLVDMEVVDVNGARCPLANDLISLDVQGPADFIGGIAKGENNYIRSKELPVEAGINRVLIRSTRKAGQIRIIARSSNLIPDTIDFQSKAVEISGGLSTTIQGNGLYSRLGRGPTPTLPSYKVSRIPVSVLKVQAGSNESEAVNSYDDNEMTEWKNDGLRSTGWIKYDLSRPANLSEICMKLTGWRTRSYNIRVIGENGEVLWEGKTPKSLGYITLPLTPGISTRSVRVELVGSGSNSDQFSSIVEVEKGKDLDLFDKNNPNGGDPKDELRIVEIEFYEKPVE